MVTKGWLKALHWRFDPKASELWRPVHPHDILEPLTSGQIVPVEIELQPSATLFRRGEVVRLDVQGRWFYSRSPLVGQFPVWYEASLPATAVLHCGGEYATHLLAPVVPSSST